eukprot:TRINITY_DN2360_c0_g1_i2.p1 TRINITY_DN2360_c0_g1~~TRINITY_DN2360_c0_g1_i2.p1  ORF type:complete len:569 (-),score=281.70 TRINITY_DN2360_c0_g1_i2:1444-2919(-)
MEAETKLAELRQQKAAMDATPTTSTNEQQLVAKLENLRMDCERDRARVQQVAQQITDQLAEKDDLVESLQLELEEMELDHEEETLILRESIEEMESAENTDNQSDTQLKALTDEHSRLNARLADETAKVADLQQAIDAMQDQVNNADPRQLESKQQLLIQSQLALDDIKEKVTRKTEKADAYERQLKEFNEQIFESDLKIADVNTQIDMVTKRILEMKESLTNEASQSSSLSEERYKLQVVRQKAEEGMEQVSDELEDTELTIEEMKLKAEELIDLLESVLEGIEDDPLPEEDEKLVIQEVINDLQWYQEALSSRATGIKDTVMSLEAELIAIEMERGVHRPTGTQETTIAKPRYFRPTKKRKEQARQQQQQQQQQASSTSSSKPKASGGPPPPPPPPPPAHIINSELNIVKTKDAIPKEVVNNPERGDLMSAIRGGLTLKKVDRSELESKKQATKGADGFNALRDAIGTMRKDMQYDSDDDGFSDDDDDW